MLLGPGEAAGSGPLVRGFLAEAPFWLPSPEASPSPGLFGGILRRSGIKQEEKEKNQRRRMTLNKVRVVHKLQRVTCSTKSSFYGGTLVMQTLSII